MSDFIVSARKYRPATFASVVGQKHITSTLQNAIERGQLAHAYLFCGPRGVGKTTCARIFAKAINCLNPNGAEACNECESCRSFDTGRSLSIHELDAASNNSVEDIRSLIEQVRIIPQVGRYSVFIIDEVHMLSQSAFNAFLKTLEEPPAHAIFILATTEKHKIIPTILSRCQIYDFNRIRVEDGVEYLKYIAAQERVEVDDESLNLIAQKADGGMRDALSMFDKAVSFCGAQLHYKEVAQTLNVLDFDTYFSVTKMLLDGDYVQTLVTFDEVLSKGFSGQTFMAGLNRHMRDLLVAQNPATLRLIEMTGTLLERYREQAAACDVGFLFGAISILTELDGKIRQSSNQRLLVELGLMKIAGLGQKKNECVAFTAYSLPELTLRTSQTPIQQPATAVERTAQVPKPKGAENDSKPEAAKPMHDVELVDREKTEDTEPKQEGQAKIAEAKVVPRRATHTPLVSGASLAELMSSASIEMDEESESGEMPDETETEACDPCCAEKLEVARQAILKLIQEKRPRFVAAFELMTFRDNTICVSVPTTELREEILRSRTAMLMRIVEIAEISGPVNLDVTVNEQICAARPFKLEDRVKHMTEKNPLLTELRKALDLEVE